LWVYSVMSTLFLLALELPVIFTTVGIYAYLRNRKSRKWILAKADKSDLEESNNI